jgi:hypothetical protein
MLVPFWKIRQEEAMILASMKSRRSFSFPSDTLAPRPYTLQYEHIIGYSGKDLYSTSYISCPFPYHSAIVSFRS